MVKVSQRAQNIIPSPIRKFLPLVQKAQGRGIYVHKLNVGDSDIPVPRAFWIALRQYRSKNIGYAPSSGVLEHVEAWVKYFRNFGVRLEPKNILPTLGCAEAMLFAMLATTDPGDEILVFEPLYSSYRGFAAMCNVKLVPLTLSLRENFSLPTFSQIEKKITKKTRAILVINPSNPAGSVLSAGEMKMLADIVKKHHLFLISDETYREIIFHEKPKTFLSFQKIRQNVIVLDSASKKFSCPGARIGCFASRNAEIMKSALRMAMIRLSAPLLEQYALIPLLANAKKETGKITREYKKRAHAVYRELKKIPGVKASRPQGALYIMAELPVKDAEDFVRFMITKFFYKNETVLVTPAKDFYITRGTGKNFIRIAYVRPVRELSRAIELLGRGLEKYKKL